MAAAYDARGHKPHPSSYHARASTQSLYPAFAASLHHVPSMLNMSAYQAGSQESLVARPHDVNHNDLEQSFDYSSGKQTTRQQAIQNSSSAQQHDIESDAFASESLLSSSQLNPAPPLIRNLAAPGQFDMLPPPSSTHASWQDLHEYAQSHASEHGYALSINTTAKNRSRIKLACVCYGQPKNTHKLTPETRVRKNRISYKTGCKMWVEGRKEKDGLWALRVGEARHNHPGRPSEGWAVQRKRTWGVSGGRIGVGGVTAKEEQARKSISGSKDIGNTGEEDEEEIVDADTRTQQPKASHSLERGGLVWRIVEQEMLRKSEQTQGRDRGVGRTVGVLQARLPGIHIFKRDVYNIRAQIKRARQAAGQEIGQGLDSDQDDIDDDAERGLDDRMHVDVNAHAASSLPQDRPNPQPNQRVPYTSVSSSSIEILPQIDPSLTAQQDTRPRRPCPLSQPGLSQLEIERLMEENAELRKILTERTAELKEKTIEAASLKSQMDFMMLSR